ncbi:hypothetical protein HYH03_007708 [Edaphochlamys debaryana]|uniref:Endonuclease/exonuclease/phosphatase domain-containing protein n=1 Tax=Edaphochlamys debaryana TaxID=47281 RepID=A0A836BYX7_9CHLO|nr:hypothetical protein HYH03_007708 [Edaphochlamys debaryana]|eukprot:KAG2494065.1 hypothetical protein HYH03_007708 [Edaphochlamys debaryana]
MLPFAQDKESLVLVRKDRFARVEQLDLYTPKQPGVAAGSPPAARTPYRALCDGIQPQALRRSCTQLLSRMCTVKLSLHDGKQLVVVSVHGPYKNLRTAYCTAAEARLTVFGFFSRVMQALSVNEKAPAIFAGDFNAGLQKLAGEIGRTQTAFAESLSQLHVLDIGDPFDPTPGGEPRASSPPDPDPKRRNGRATVDFIGYCSAAPGALQPSWQSVDWAPLPPSREAAREAWHPETVARLDEHDAGALTKQTASSAKAGGAGDGREEKAAGGRKGKAGRPQRYARFWVTEADYARVFHHMLDHVPIIASFNLARAFKTISWWPQAAQSGSSQGAAAAAAPAGTKGAGTEERLQAVGLSRAKTEAAGARAGPPGAKEPASPARVRSAAGGGGEERGTELRPAPPTRVAVPPLAGTKEEGAKTRAKPEANVEAKECGRNSDPAQKLLPKLDAAAGEEVGAGKAEPGPADAASRAGQGEKATKGVGSLLAKMEAAPKAFRVAKVEAVPEMAARAPRAEAGTKTAAGDADGKAPGGKKTESKVLAGVR